MLDSNKRINTLEKNPLGTDSDGRPFDEPWEYASFVVMLMYLSINFRPDIQFSVHQCARFTHNPMGGHSESVKRICIYLVVTQGKGLTFYLNSDLNLECYVDADFAGICKHKYDKDPVCSKSRTGCVMTLGGCLLHWVSNIHTDIALPTLKYE